VPIWILRALFPGDGVHLPLLARIVVLVTVILLGILFRRHRRVIVYLLSLSAFTTQATVFVSLMLERLKAGYPWYKS
jgi:hypothetical protein